MPTNALENTFNMSSLSLVDFYELECKYVLETALYACTRATILVYCVNICFLMMRLHWYMQNSSVVLRLVMQYCYTYFIAFKFFGIISSGVL